MNKKKTILSLIAIIAIFAATAKFSAKKPATIEEKQLQLQNVSVQSASDSKVLTSVVQYPASVVGDQEIAITSRSAGTVSGLTYNIGDKINVGALLARIDDTGSLGIGDQGFRNLQIQQAQLAVDQAKKAYGLAKDIYDSIRKDKSATGQQKDTAREQVAMAKIQYENAQLGLSGSVDNHLITSPISGVIIERAVAVGDSVSIGQLIATVSKSTNIKLQFFVDQNQRNSLTRGQDISAFDADGNQLSLKITNIAAAADQATKRFLIEAVPAKPAITPLLSGTILTVTFKNDIKPHDSKNLILPLSAINVGQNESYIFVADNGTARKVTVTVIDVNGETAEISSGLGAEALIITDGNKLVHDGERITINK